MSCWPPSLMCTTNMIDEWENARVSRLVFPTATGQCTATGCAYCFIIHVCYLAVLVCVYVRVCMHVCVGGGACTCGVCVRARVCVCVCVRQLQQSVDQHWCATVQCVGVHTYMVAALHAPSSDHGKWCHVLIVTYCSSNRLHTVLAWCMYVWCLLSMICC